MSRRGVLSLALSGSAVILLAACGQAAVAPAPGATATTAAPKAAEPVAKTEAITLRFGNGWYEDARAEVIEEAIPQFMADNPHITVEVESLEGEAFGKVLVQIVAGTAPDVFLSTGSAFQTLADSDSLADITPILKTQGVDMADYAVTSGSIMKEGKQYGMPFQLGVGAWFYNVDMFEKAGLEPPNAEWTWDNVLEASRALSPADRSQFGMLAQPELFFWQNWVLSNGGELINEDFTETLLASDAGKQAFTAYIELITKHQVAPNLTEQEAGADFYHGKTGMFEGTSAILNRIVSRSQGAFAWDLMYQPKSPFTGQRRTVYGDQPHLVNGKSAQLDEAVQLTVFLSGPFTQGLVAKTRASTPVLRSILNSPDFLASPPNSMHIVGETLEYAEERGNFTKVGDWNEAIDTECLKAFQGLLAPGDALENAAAIADGILAG